MKKLKLNSAGIDSFTSSFLRSTPSPCSYFPERESRFLFASSPYTPNPRVIDHLLDRGFRRAGDIYYATECERCRMCIPYRIPLNGFRRNRSQTRNLGQNQNLRVSFETPALSTEKIRLYVRYIRSVHNDESVESEDDFSLLETMETQMYTNTESSVEILVREESGNLVGFGILDIGEKNVSSVYNVYDPDYRVRGLGTFMILKSLEWAILEEGLEYLHLGLWIPGHPKMHYKKNFGPGEVLHPLTRSWTQFNSNDWI